MKKTHLYLLGILVILVILTILVWNALIALQPTNELRVSILNIGQGDSIFIESPTHQQVIIDGGRDRTVLRELSQVSRWFDRTIDVMIATHPDADHISGLVDVLSRYKVDTVMHPGVNKNTGPAENLLVSIAGEKAKEIIGRRGQIIDIGGGAYIEVLWPDRDVSEVETNDGCIVTRVAYGETAFMLSCDAPIAVEEYLVRLDGTKLKSNVYKAGHHGSRTSSAPAFVGFIDPEFGVYSRGCDNSYGHPHKEVVDVFARFGVKTFDTCTDGRVTFVSDGQTVKKI